MEKQNFTFSIELFTFHSSISAKRKTCFSQKENLKKCTSFEEKKVQGIFVKPFILTSLSSVIFCLQNRVSDFF